MKISVCAPSYKRAQNITTKETIKGVKYYVDGSEYDDYLKYNKDELIVKCDDGIQGNICRVRNYILKTEFENGADVVLIADDDFRGLYYWEHREKHKVEDLLSFLEKYSLMAKDLGAYFWGVNINQEKQCYREYTPFSMVSFIGGPFQCFLKGNECWYDEKLPLKEDYDMTLQQCNKYRKVFRVNKYFYDCKQSEQKGGCAAYRNLDREKEQFYLLQKKWGSAIVKRDSNNRSHNLVRAKKKEDYNPIIKVPIKGV